MWLSFQIVNAMLGFGGGESTVALATTITASNVFITKHSEHFELCNSNAAYCINATCMGMAKTGYEPMMVYHIVNGNAGVRS